MSYTFRTAYAKATSDAPCCHARLFHARGQIAAVGGINVAYHVTVAQRNLLRQVQQVVGDFISHDEFFC